MSTSVRYDPIICSIRLLEDNSKIKYNNLLLFTYYGVCTCLGVTVNKTALPTGMKLSVCKGLLLRVAFKCRGDVTAIGKITEIIEHTIRHLK